ncbi:hypothetical protein F5Y11DRAFT_61115 [Daldinia sp. FL1419]|nr:hypothetical protein F5Y11DRAFT_61115 [Daldinia sp. FL1419]
MYPLFTNIFTSLLTLGFSPTLHVPHLPQPSCTSCFSLLMCIIRNHRLVPAIPYDIHAFDSLAQATCPRCTGSLDNKAQGVLVARRPIHSARSESNPGVHACNDYRRYTNAS